MNHGLITLNSQHWVDDYLLDQWLIRFWINGTPITIQKTEPRKIRIMHAEARRIVEPTQFQFHLDLAPNLLHAQPNDRLEFQLLYCPDGIDWGDQTMLQAFAISDHPGPRLTNQTKWNP